MKTFGNCLTYVLEQPAASTFRAAGFKMLIQKCMTSSCGPYGRQEKTMQVGKPEGKIPLGRNRMGQHGLD
jgi:hypothetical protein